MCTSREPERRGAARSEHRACVNSRRMRLQKALTSLGGWTRHIIRTAAAATVPHSILPVTGRVPPSTRFAQRPNLAGVTGMAYGE